MGCKIYLNFVYTSSTLNFTILTFSKNRWADICPSTALEGHVLHSWFSACPFLTSSKSILFLEPIPRPTGQSVAVWVHFCRGGWSANWPFGHRSSALFCNSWWMDGRFYEIPSTAFGSSSWQAQWLLDWTNFLCEMEGRLDYEYSLTDYHCHVVSYTLPGIAELKT